MICLFITSNLIKLGVRYAMTKIKMTRFSMKNFWSKITMKQQTSSSKLWIQNTGKKLPLKRLITRLELQSSESVNSSSTGLAVPSVKIKSLIINWSIIWITTWKFTWNSTGSISTIPHNNSRIFFKCRLMANLLITKLCLMIPLGIS